MARSRATSVLWTSRIALFAGSLLFLMGALVGRVIPGVGSGVFSTHLSMPISKSMDAGANAFLGADVTALAVIVAVLIGFNVAALQIAGSSLSLGLVRTILFSLMPYLVCWCLATSVTLWYFLHPPITTGELILVFLWFFGVILLMIGYLWRLPLVLRGEFAVTWAIAQLKGKQVAKWYEYEAYTVMQTTVSAASRRDELIPVWNMTTMIGRTLASSLDKDAENTTSADAHGYERIRYRVLKNLLTGCSQQIAPSANGIAYSLGFIMAGVLLQSVALGIQLDLSERNVFSGLFRATNGVGARIVPLWTGMRHGLFRQTFDDRPSYLSEYWYSHKRWWSNGLSSRDPRALDKIADGIMLVFVQCWRILSGNAITGVEPEPVLSGAGVRSTPIATFPTNRFQDGLGDDANMLVKLYNDIHLRLALEINGSTRVGFHMFDTTARSLPLELLKAIQKRVERDWYPSASESSQDAVTRAYIQALHALGDDTGSNTIISVAASSSDQAR